METTKSEQMAAWAHKLKCAKTPTIMCEGCGPLDADDLAKIGEALAEAAELRKRIEGLNCGEDFLVVPRKMWNETAATVTAYEDEIAVAACTARDHGQSAYTCDEVADWFDRIKTEVKDNLKRKAQNGEREWISLVICP